jgi:hypothetical protein
VDRRIGIETDAALGRALPASLSRSLGRLKVESELSRMSPAALQMSRTYDG